MAYAVRSSSNTRNTSTDNSNLWPGQFSIRFRRVRRQEGVDEPLDDLVQEEERIEEGIRKLRPGSHCVSTQSQLTNDFLTRQ